MEIDEETNFTPRPYQDEILSLAIRSNTIIYLPTGSGKTFIAFLVIRHFSKDLTRSLDEGGKRSIFLANTVVLAHQQAKYLENMLSVKVKVYTGDMNVDAWRREKWREEFQKNQVIVATSQIVLDVIRHGFLSIRDINVLVFDECHHGTGEHNMRQIMQQFQYISKSEQPRVIGLTGMLLKGQVKSTNVMELVEKLEITFQSTIRTVSSTETFINVLSFSTNPKEMLINYDKGPFVRSIDKIKAIVNKIMVDIRDWPLEKTIVNKYVKKINSFAVNNARFDEEPISTSKFEKLFKDFLYQLEDTGIYGAWIAIPSVIIDLELKRRMADTKIQKYLIRVLITNCEMIYTLLEQEMRNFTTNVERILQFGSNKIKQLIVFLEEYVQKNGAKDLKCLIFTHRRHTAKCLSYVLKYYAENNPLFDIRPDFMVGVNNRIPGSIELLLEHKWNRKVLDRFKKDELNLICSTSVLEEGVDLQMCNVVISYDNPLTFQSYIQSKGRARMSTSNYVIMCDSENRQKLLENLQDYQKIEKILRNYLVGKSVDRKPPLDDDIYNELYRHAIRPFYTREGAKLERVSAVPLINRYCMNLPRDKFSNPSIIWTEEKLEDSGEFVITLDLPVQSKIKTSIRGDPFKSLRIAKQSAAFKACVQLYQIGELNERLLPISSENNLKNFNDSYFKHWEENENDNSKLTGTKKNYRMYNFKYPEQLNECRPELGVICYLYIIQMSTAPSSIFSFEDINTNGSEIFKDLINSERNYGILTTKPIPNLPLVKLFLSIGEINVEYISEPIRIRINLENDLNLLKNFHLMLFRDLLKTWKDFFVFDNENAENSYMIVPVINKAIDWNIVGKFQKLPEAKEIPLNKRQKLQFIKEEYLHNVIFPIYRADHDLRYIVIDVMEYKTPKTKFPNDSFLDFKDYFQTKYQQTILNDDQFLIEVKGITTGLNRLHPQTQQKNKRSFFQETHIPEICHNFKFPGDLWLKAVLLPTTLHRLQFILNAENLRKSIVNFMNIDDSNYQPLKLDIDKNFKEESYEDEEMSRPIPNHLLIPNPDNVVAKNVPSNEFIPLCDILDHPWKVAEEPLDIDRNWEKSYPVDLDYYHFFISRKIDDLTDEINKIEIANVEINQINKPLPICDSSIKENNINLLNTNNLISPETKNLIKAITLSSSSDVYDMERYEVLGDSFLKLSISILAYTDNPDWHEGYLTAFRSKIVSNRNLYYCGIKLGLNEIMKIQQFQPKNDWQPPLLTVPRVLKNQMKEIGISCNYLYKLELSHEEIESGELLKDNFEKFLLNVLQEMTNEPSSDVSSINNFFQQHYISDKSISDAVEAILGVCVEAFGIKNSLKMLQFFNIVPKDVTNLFNIKPYNILINDNITQRDIDEHLVNYPVLEDALGYQFKNRAYLLQALTHASYSMNRYTRSYEQLEFLGDAILDFLITSYIFERCTDMDPGKLTDLRSALVNNATLACITVRNKFHLFLLHQNAALSETIARFVEFQEKQQHKVTDEVQLLVDEESMSLAELVDVPKALGDVFESLIGAIFLDSNKSLEITWNIIYRLLQNEIREFIENVPLQIIRRLYEFPKAKPKFSDPVFVEDGTVMVDLRFTKLDDILIVSGFGQNKEDAKRAAAKLALQKLMFN